MADYVIIGAGAAGCVLANRLSADPSVKVLLLEAGGRDTNPKIHIPATYGAGLFKSAVDWNYSTTPQANMCNRELFWPRGKVLGGSTSINAMIYIRGHRWDYDHWRELGNPGWGYSDVLPIFKQSEHQERGEDPWHGVGGEWNVADLISPNILTQTYVQAAERAGLKHNADFNGAEQDGCGMYQVSQKHGRRHSTAAAFLKPVLNRPNLTVLTGALVTKIHVESGRVVSVSYQHQGQVKTERINREVLLCGGAVNSPQVLMLSGIGPADHLRALGIPVIHDLPGVGENLHDHIAAGLFMYATQPISLSQATKPRHVLEYLLFRRGLLTSNVGEGAAFIRTQTNSPAPDIQFHFGPVHYLNHGMTKMPGDGFALGPVLLRPASRGTLRLRSADPAAAPLIDPAYLTDPADIEPLVEGIKLAQEIIYSPPFNAFRGKPVLPEQRLNTDEQFRDYIQAHGETLYHPVGTCMMGPATDPLAVVDSELRVRGLAGLRVVDASVMPQVVSGNTAAPTVMIAEKAAASILGM
jgi:choline dehydrogenase